MQIAGQGEIEEKVFEPNAVFAKTGVSPIMALGELARKMKKEGHDVILLGAGEPDFDTPQNVKEAGIAAIQNGITKYTPVHGIPEAKAAVRRKFERDQKIIYSDDEIAISTGAKQLLFNSLVVSLNAGDEVVIPSPVWSSYPAIVKIAGGTPVMVHASAANGFKVTAAELEAAISPRTRWLMINSPSNPTGAVYSREELAALADVLRRHPQVWILTDEIYEKIVFDGKPFVSFVDAAPDLAGRMLVVNGVSKAQAMTGWRIGYAGGPAKLIAAMAALQSQSTTSACSIAQAATITALDDTDETVAQQCREYERRRDLVVKELNETNVLSCPKSEGAFYAFASMEGLVGCKHADGVINNDDDFCKYILNDAKVAIVPGIIFGAPNYFRISIATSYELLAEAMKRIKSSVAKLN
ncbi:pyridoxal phosphate-dependent aminotransferase [uncultured Ruegeria sp.]|uniref:pyridoxal phosphate-dependent aminotransferase n=1 Tax=uncultured Ruegeria sp. TaxID=259304 RepID=UPI002615A831|nr:pyridoxal phosphate-dependent aminotransferase [uncultured Ruegeria sp.]